MRSFKVAGIGAAALGIVFAAAAATSGIDRQPATLTHTAGTALHLPGVQRPINVNTVRQHLKSTLTSKGYSGLTLPPGAIVAIDPGDTVTCPGIAACTLEAQMSVQLEGTDDVDTYALCFYVDGSAVTCIDLGYLTYPIAPQGASFDETDPRVPPGTHTVETRVFTSDGAAVDNYNIVYHVYKP